MTRRQVPRWRHLRPILRFRAVGPPSIERRLREARTIGDLRAIARARAPRAVFDYVDGAAESESSLERSRQAFRAVEFRPRVLRDVSTVQLGTRILGRPSALPIALAPTGFTRMLHHEGERAVARVAERVGIPHALSTLGTTSIESIASVAPAARRWFQLYMFRDRGVSMELLRRAQAAGCEALLVTVDAPVGGMRLRDVRNGLTIPPSLTIRTLLDVLRRPRWWLDLITTEPLEFASLSGWAGTAGELGDAMFDPSLTAGDIADIRDLWTGPLVIKGIQTVADAVIVADLGADAIVISNHGGRQLDRAPTPLRLLPHVVDAVGERLEVLLDGGILHGGDILAARAHGASACLIGRAHLYGLMAGGERGVERSVQVLADEMRRTLAFLGVADIGELTPGHVSLGAPAPTAVADQR